MWGSVKNHAREMRPVETTRRCLCGCKQRATHAGYCNGVAMTAPMCELVIRRWVRDAVMTKTVTKPR